MDHFQFVRETVSSGRYGRVLGLNSHLARPWLQLCGGTWRQNLSFSGGGQINDGGSHLIDIVLWVTGLRAERVSALMDNRGTEVDIDSVVSIVFEGGAFGSLTIIGDSCAWHERHHVWLEKAALLFGKDDLTIIDDVGRTIEVSGWAKPVTPDENFVDAIRTGTDVLAPFECGLRTIELTEAAWTSRDRGGIPVEVPGP
jgi:predicted dehydrogenase